MVLNGGFNFRVEDNFKKFGLPYYLVELGYYFLCFSFLCLYFVSPLRFKFILLLKKTLILLCACNFVLMSFPCKMHNSQSYNGDWIF